MEKELMWYEEEPLDPKLVKHKLDGEHIKPENVKVDTANQRAEIQGHGADPYDVTLFNCTCPDYIFNGRNPCKHMFRLAEELGLQKHYPSFDRDQDRNYAQALEGTILDLFEQGKVSPNFYVRICEAAEKV